MDVTRVVAVVTKYPSTQQLFIELFVRECKQGKYKHDACSHGSHNLVGEIDMK